MFADFGDVVDEVVDAVDVVGGRDVAEDVVVVLMRCPPQKDGF